MSQRLKEILYKYRHAWTFSYILIYIPWYLYLERSITDKYTVIHSRLDDMIPFNEYFIIPYCFWFLYISMFLFFFFFKDSNEFYRYGFYLALGMSICLFICQIFPNGTHLRPNINPDKNWASWLVSLIYRADTSTNVFPSIHVYNSIGTHIAICKSRFFKDRPGIKLFSLISAVSIIASTVFLKQHSALDVIGATILSYFTYQVVYSKEALSVYEKRAGEIPSN